MTRNYKNINYKDKQGLNHRSGNLPAVIWENGTEEYFVHGRRHRDNDLPAVVYPSGAKHWYEDGVRHRGNDKPAVEIPQPTAGGTLYHWYWKGKHCGTAGSPNAIPHLYKERKMGEIMPIHLLTRKLS